MSNLFSLEHAAEKPERLSNGIMLLLQGSARCIGDCALILFFIYNKHFQVNGNIDPVDEGGNAPQAAGNEIKVVRTSPGFGPIPLYERVWSLRIRAEKRGSDGKAEHGLQGSV
ncbi:hypothetical protein [Rhizobium sp. R635]|uniref:hypothetical protein n=1 Tax=Rhizobium sp. R635 TaxID=1764275 RepID=UPI000B537C9C|nr:hypothetical protein [Rhizobium sp. R635]